MGEYFTPWVNKADLLRTRNQIYGGDNRQDAVDRIEMWILRGGCPHAVESTCVVTNALLYSEDPSVSDLTVKQLLAMALQRFVTGFCDINQGSGSKSAMSALAEELGLPARLVNLRHEIVHRSIPSRVRLETGCRDALAWLWSYYWAPLDGSDRIIGADDVQQTKDILKSFLKARKQEIRMNGGSASAKSCCEALVNICCGAPSTAESRMIAQCLAGPDSVIVPRKRSRGDPMDGAFLMFDPLLRKLLRIFPEVLGLTIKSMADRIINARGSEDVQLQLEGLQLWIVHLFADEPWSSSERAREQTEPLRRDIVTRSGRLCLTPSVWSARLCEGLVHSASTSFQEAMSMNMPSYDFPEACF